MALSIGSGVHVRLVDSPVISTPLSGFFAGLWGEVPVMTAVASTRPNTSSETARRNGADSIKPHPSGSGIGLAGSIPLWRGTLRDSVPAAKAGDRLLTLKEVAQRLGIGRTKTYELIASGVLPYVELRPRWRRAPESALDEWIRRNTKEPEYTLQ